MPRYRDYQEELIECLQDHDEAIAYLNAAWEESLKGDEESQQLFLLALRNVAEAQGGLGKLAKKVHIRREQLYRILSPPRQPWPQNHPVPSHRPRCEFAFCLGSVP